MLKRIVSLLILVVWPLSLYLANTTHNFLAYSVPSLLIIFSILLITKNNKYYFLPIFLITLFEPKFAILPLLFFGFNFKSHKKVFGILAMIMLIIFWNPFLRQTIFKFDYQAKQEILQKSNLYPSIFLARLFQNKPRIIINKFNDNFFALIDPNNYFFGFHPRQIVVDNQNLKKFPFLSLVLLIYSVIFLKKDKTTKKILLLTLPLIINLSILSRFDRNDFILWYPLSFLILRGLNLLPKGEKTNLFYIMFILFSFIELTRIIIQFTI